MLYDFSITPKHISSFGRFVFPTPGPVVKVIMLFIIYVMYCLIIMCKLNIEAMKIKVNPGLTPSPLNSGVVGRQRG